MRWAGVGIACGLVLPLGGLFFDAFVLNRGEATLAALMLAHPIHFVALGAPGIVGLAFALVGRMRARQVYGALRRRAAARRHERLANTDSLTGCGNRHKLMNDIARLLPMRPAAGFRPLLFLIDLDKFKAVNDTLGHATGDLLLKSVAERLQCPVPDIARTYRLGGDEFVVLLPGSAGVEAEDFAESLLSLLVAPFDLAGRRVKIGASIGFAALEECDTRPEDVLGRADLALYAAKRRPAGGWCRFAAEMANAAARSREIEAELRLGLTRDEFFLEFQPIFGVERNDIVSVEALLRWKNPGRGLLAPDSFLGIAEACGLIVPIGEAVLGMACRAARDWPEPISVSVNVAVEQVLDPGFCSRVAGALATTRLPAERLILEVTERLLSADRDIVSHVVDRLKEIGVRFALDGFGAGLSSITLLRRLPLDYLKLDRSLLSELDAAPAERDLIDSMVVLSHSLHLTTTLEGVERADQMDLARTGGIDRAQGFYLARPMTQDRLALLFAGKSRRLKSA